MAPVKVARTNIVLKRAHHVSTEPLEGSGPRAQTELRMLNLTVFAGLMSADGHEHP